MINVFIDFETFYDEKAKYSLKNMPTLEYIRDPRFKVLGMSVAVNKGTVKWVPCEQCADFFEKLKDSKVKIRFIGHNASFDAAVAKETYGYVADEYACTMFMARYLISQGILPHDIGTALKEVAPFVDSEKLNLSAALEDDTLDTYAIRDTEICRDFYYKYINQVPADEQSYINTHVQMSAIAKFNLDTPLLEDCLAADEKRQALYPTVRKDDLFIKAMARYGETVQFKTTAKGNKKPALSKTDDYMKYLLQHPNPKVKALAELRLEAKSTCERSKAQRFLDIGSPLACPVVYYGAHTGRSAGGEKMNVQNMPRGSKIRTALRAPAGYKLLIIDSSQVEVRTLGWLAGEQRLLDVFRRGEDIYKHFGANDLFHKPIEEITKEERQISKPPVLAAGFGQSGPGLAAYAKRMGVELSPEMAERCVQAYRAGYPAITGGPCMSRDGYWKRAEQFVAEHGYSVLPSGRRLTYPNLRWEQGKLVFDKHRIFLRDSASARLWHGSITENCLAEDTNVLVKHKGIIPMKLVKKGDFVFDGEEYVRCDGFIGKGKRVVINRWGFTMTPDHKVLCGEGYKEFKDVEYEAARRTAEEIIGDSERGLYVSSILRSFSRPVESTVEERSFLGSKMYKMRSRKNCTRKLFFGRRNNGVQGLLQKKGKEKRRQTSCCMAKYGSTMPKQKTQSIQKLRWPGYICLQGVVGLFELLQGWARNGQNRQQQRLFSGKCKICDKETKYKQQKKLPADTGRGGMDNCQSVHGEIREKKEYNILSRVKRELNKQKVGDLLNCGPNHRFMAISKAGVPFIVHNCVQAAARDLVFWQVEEIKRRAPYAEVALMVHDEAVFVVPEDKAEEALAIADACFKENPPFMKGMPCQGEGHISDCYDK